MHMELGFSVLLMKSGKDVVARQVTFDQLLLSNSVNSIQSGFEL